MIKVNQPISTTIKAKQAAVIANTNDGDPIYINSQRFIVSSKFTRFGKTYLKLDNTNKIVCWDNNSNIGFIVASSRTFTKRSLIIGLSHNATFTP